MAVHQPENPLYHLDIVELKSQLKNASVSGKSAKALEILIPTLEGRLERFSVYSAPVVVEELSKQYDLNSYVGIGLDDSNKYLRFSVSGNDFQSMIIEDGNYQFIEPQDKNKGYYRVFPKRSTGDLPFTCTTDESIQSKHQIHQLFKQSQLNFFNATNFARSSDRKFRTYRLALSTTGEYTAYFGGVPEALIAINATLTRVNGILEKDLAVRLELQNFPNLIYTDPATDPYSNAYIGAKGKWSLELQNNLTATIGNDSYDIGHLFGRSGGSGNAGCVGCICVDNNKGSAFTSPADGKPQGDTFDIDFVAHEIGHQLGANHTFSYKLENIGVNMEPGSGSTIMGYAGTTNANVQKNTDPYFHTISISQIQQNLSTKTCGFIRDISNNPPVISPMPDYHIPLSTPFVLNANVTDAENDPLTYTWEQVDNATTIITQTTGKNETGALFRSIKPDTNPTRYFPKLSLVMNQILTSKKEWESVSNIARDINFRMTARDNHPNAEEQQTSFATQKIIVGSDGPFKINLDADANLFAGVNNTISWNVANTNRAPYNVDNVKISYTLDQGNEWTTLKDSTPNDGSESIVIPSKLANKSNFQLRIEALGNVFYTVSPKLNLVFPNSCLVTTPTEIEVKDLAFNSAAISWAIIPNISRYVLEYRKHGDFNFTTVELQTNSYVINNLESDSAYEFRLKSKCLDSESEYSNIETFITPKNTNCTSHSNNGTNEYIQKVEIDGYMISSGYSTYTDFTQESFRAFYLNTHSKEFNVRITPKWKTDKTPISVAVWIDFNGNEIFETNEKILAKENTTEEELLETFTLPNSVSLLPEGVKMRVSLKKGSVLPLPCKNFDFGEVEDFKIIFVNTPIDTEKVTIYPNPFTDYLYTTNVKMGTNFRVFDFSGKLIKSGKIFLNKIDLSMLPIGNYIIEIEGQESVKIIKSLTKSKF